MYVLVETKGGSVTANTYQFSDMSGLYTWIKGQVNDTSDKEGAALLRQINEMITGHISKGGNCDKKEDTNDVKPTATETTVNVKSNESCIIANNNTKRDIVLYFINNFCDKIKYVSGASINHSEIVRYAFMLFLLDPGSIYDVKFNISQSANGLKRALAEVYGLLGCNLYKLRNDIEHPILKLFYERCYCYEPDSLFYYYKLYRLVFHNIYSGFMEGKPLDDPSKYISPYDIIDTFTEHSIKSEDKIHKKNIKSTTLYNIFIEFMGLLHSNMPKIKIEAMYTHKLFSNYMKYSGFETVRKSEGIFYKDISIIGPLSRMNSTDIAYETEVVIATVEATAGVTVETASEPTILPYDDDENINKYSSYELHGSSLLALFNTSSPAAAVTIKGQ